MKRHYLSSLEALEFSVFQEEHALRIYPNWMVRYFESLTEKEQWQYFLAYRKVADQMLSESYLIDQLKWILKYPSIELESFGMVVCFCLLGYAAGVFVRNGYGAFIAAALVIGITFLVKVLFPIGSVSRAIWGLTPIWLWKNSGMWFTDGGADIIWANFEGVGLFVSLTVLSTITFIATKVYNKWGLL